MGTASEGHISRITHTHTFYIYISAHTLTQQADVDLWAYGGWTGILPATCSMCASGKKTHQMLKYSHEIILMIITLKRPTRL